MLGLGWSHHGHKFKNVNNALSPSFQLWLECSAVSPEFRSSAGFVCRQAKLLTACLIDQRHHFLIFFRSSRSKHGTIKLNCEFRVV